MIKFVRLALLFRASFSKRVQPPTTFHNQPIPYQQQYPEELVNVLSQLSLKYLAVQVHHCLVQKHTTPDFWAAIYNEFSSRIEATTDPVKIRSYSKLLYSLSKSKHQCLNYETKMALLLPFATPYSFTTIVTALSRIGPLSQYFSYIIEKLYYKLKPILRPRYVNSINYVLARNGRQIDTAIISYMDNFNCLETMLMLRSYDISGSLNQYLLTKILKKVIEIKSELNVLDLADLIEVYLKHHYTPDSFEQLIGEQYNILKMNVNEQALYKIWKYMPENVNEGNLRIHFVLEVIKTMKVLRKKTLISERAWSILRKTFHEIDNLYIRTELERIK